MRQNAFEGLETRIMERIENSVYQELGSHLGLTDAHSNIEQDQLIRSEYKLAQHILHEPKNVRIVKQISYQALNTVSSHALEGSSRFAAFGTNLAVAASQSVVASTDIMPLANEMAEGLRSEIARLDAATKAMFAQHQQPLVGDEAVRRSLSHKLAELGARYIMNAVEGRVIGPIASVATGKVIDMAVGDFARAQQELLAEYHAKQRAQSDGGTLRASGGPLNTDEEVEGLPWLDEDDSNKTGVTKKPTHSGYKKDHRQEPAVSKPHVEKAKTLLKVSPKRATAEQKAEENAACERVLNAIKLHEQMLGAPMLDSELSLLSKTEARAIYVTENGIFQSVFGAGNPGKPVVVERSYDQSMHDASSYNPGLIEQAVKSVARNLTAKTKEALEYIDRTGNTERLEFFLKTLKVYTYTLAGMRSAIAGAGIGSAISGAGSMVGAGLGFVGGIVQQCAIDTVSDEGIHLASVVIQSQFPSLTPEEANMLAVATVITAGSTKVAKDYLQKHWKPVGATSGGACKSDAFAGAIVGAETNAGAHAAEDALRNGTFLYEQKLHPSRKMETHLKDTYGAENVSSTTLPSSNKKNVKLAGERHHTVHDIIYDTKGFPVFEKYVSYETKLPTEIAMVKNDRAHMRAATRDLRNQIELGKIDRKNFNEVQLQDIYKGQETIDGYSWHHHQDRGRMQLIRRDIHNKVRHVGGMNMWFNE